MMQWLWQWARGNWSRAFLMAFCGLLLAYSGVLSYRLSAERADVNACRGRAVSLQASNASLLASLREQNASIMQWQQAGRARQEAVKKARKTAEAQWRIAERAAHGFFQHQSDVHGECDSLRSSISSYISRVRSDMAQQDDK